MKHRTESTQRNPDEPAMPGEVERDTTRCALMILPSASMRAAMNRRGIPTRRKPHGVVDAHEYLALPISEVMGE
ncbi:hypothetical protein V3H56_09520 [Pseudomonas sp. MS646]|uniref:hypothetical protein n=1 Tax=Pseudomonas sp. MS646 TaxID=3118751 RepID=UPI0030D48784